MPRSGPPHGSGTCALPEGRPSSACRPSAGATRSAALRPTSFLRPGVDTAPLFTAAADSDPENLAIETPVMIIQGAAEGNTLSLFDDRLAKELI